MSLKSWKAEFYPVHASETYSMKKAIDHSLLKWKGFLKENLDKHEIQTDRFGDLIDDVNNRQMEIYSSSCALCFHYEEDDDCKECPLCIARDNVKCDNERFDEDEAPWYTWKDKQNPLPMIMWLEKAKEMHRE